MTAIKHPSAQNVKKFKESGFLKRSLAILGPGLITGAADDDPSGISTYSVAGAAYGYATLWIATPPLILLVILLTNIHNVIGKHAATQIFRLGYFRCYDCGGRRNAHYVLSVSAGGCKYWEEPYRYSGCYQKKTQWRTRSYDDAWLGRHLKAFPNLDRAYCFGPRHRKDHQYQCLIRISVSALHRPGN